MKGVLKTMLVKQARKLIKAKTLVCFLVSAGLLSGCTSSMTSQLKESPCKTCTEKPVFYRNGEWLEGETR